MRIAVIGLGGVGGYIAASLAKAGCSVEGFARGEHLEVIQQEGLCVVEDAQQWCVRLEAKELREAKGVYDLLLFCVKSYDLEASAAAMAAHTDAKSISISFANGINNAEVLRKYLQGSVLEGAVYILAHKQKAGVIRKEGSVFAAVFGGEEEAAKRVGEIFTVAGLRYKTPQNIREALWKKYLFISAFAALTSYYDASIGTVMQSNEAEAKALLEEIAAVAKSEGIVLDEEIDKALTTATKVPQEASTSMHLDFQNNRATELESLCGYIAKHQGAPTPLMQKIYRHLSSER